MKTVRRSLMFLLVVCTFTGFDGELFASSKFQEIEYIVNPGSAAPGETKVCQIRESYVIKKIQLDSGLKWVKQEQIISNFVDKSENFYPLVLASYKQQENGPLSVPQVQIFYTYFDQEKSFKKLVYTSGPTNGALNSPVVQEVLSIVKSVCSF